MDEDQLYIDVPPYTPPRLGTDMLQPDLIPRARSRRGASWSPAWRAALTEVVAYLRCLEGRLLGNSCRSSVMAGKTRRLV